MFFKSSIRLGFRSEVEGPRHGVLVFLGAGRVLERHVSEFIVDVSGLWLDRKLFCVPENPTREPWIK